MPKNKKGLITIVGLGLAVGSVIFGIALMFMGSGGGSTHPAPEEHAKKAKAEDPGHDAHGAKKQEVGETKQDEHGGGHTKETPKKSKIPEKSLALKIAQGEITAAENDPDLDQQLGFESLYERGAQALALGQYDKARMLFEKATDLKHRDTQKPRCMIRLADATLESDSLAMQKRTTKALSLYASVIVDFPAFSGVEHAQYMLGECYMRISQPAKAIDAYERYLKLFPKGDYHAKARFGKAKALLLREENAPAFGLLENLRKEKLDKSFMAEVEKELANAKLRLAREGLYPESDGVVKAEVILPSELFKPDPPKTQPEPEMKADKKETDGVEDHPDTNVANDQEQVVTIVPGKIDFAGPVISNNVGIPQFQWDAARQSLHRGDEKRAQYLLMPWLKQHDASQDLLSRRWAAFAELLQHVAQHHDANVKKTEIRTALGAP